MAYLKIKNAQFKLYQNRFLDLPELQINTDDFWVVVGSNGSGKTAFSLALSGKLPLYAGHYENHFNRICVLSFEKQQAILAQTFKERNNDMVSPDDFGKTAQQIILHKSDNIELCRYYAQQLNIGTLLQRPFMQLSTGESRKVLLAQALVSEPDLLILDEPFAGLDKQSVRDWQDLLHRLKQKNGAGADNQPFCRNSSGGNTFSIIRT